MKKILLPHQLYPPHLDFVENRVTSERKEDFLSSLDKKVDGKKAMVYVHIPYCDSKCSFCGFNKSDNVSHVERYVRALKQEIDFYASRRYVRGLEITGIHIGGGTPTYLPSEMLEQLIDYVRDRFNAQNTDLNIEGSATTLKDNAIDMLKKKNVSRVSFGVQTFNGDLRKQLNIKASLEDVASTVSKLKSKSITTYIDLMYGFPDFGIEEQSRIAGYDARRAIELGVDGLDFSQFYPFHNPLEVRINRESLKFPSSDEVVETIKAVTGILESAGYVQTTEYSFCKKGDVMLEKSYFGEDEGIVDCIALGPSSIGLLNGTRYRNTRYPVYYERETPALLQLKRLTPDEIERAPIVGFPKVLRLGKNQLPKSLMQEYQEGFEKLKEEGLVVESQDSFELTEKGKCYVSNIQLFLMSENERRLVEEQLKILTLE